MAVSNIEQDFIDLFTGKRSAHLSKYVHLHRPEIYEQLVNEKTYYPFRLECKIIKDYAREIIHDIPRVSHVIEFGPGSASPVIAKSVPMIAALDNCFGLTQYSAADINIEYASDACKIVKEKFRNVNTNVVPLDFILDDLAKIMSFESRNNDRLIISFGCTVFGNNSDIDTEKTIENISRILKQNEFFVFGVDISSNQQALAIAYYHDLTYQLMLNAMFGLKYEIGDEHFDATAFKPIFEWIKNTSTLKFSLEATKSQVVMINSQKINVEKNTKYNIINSRKTTIDEVRRVLFKHHIEIVDTVVIKDEFGNEFAMIKSRKLGS